VRWLLSSFRIHVQSSAIRALGFASKAAPHTGLQLSLGQTLCSGASMPARKHLETTMTHKAQTRQSPHAQVVQLQPNWLLKPCRSDCSWLGLRHTENCRKPSITACYQYTAASSQSLCARRMISSPAHHTSLLTPLAKVRHLGWNQDCVRITPIQPSSSNTSRNMPQPWCSSLIH